MSTITEPMLNEFREEAATTKCILERVPANKLAWRPHEKSMSIGQLAIHIAMVPGAFARIIKADSFDVAQAKFVPPQPKAVDEIHSAFAQSVRDVEECLSSMSDQTAQAGWRLMVREKQISERPRASVLRSLMLNHWYHHRGQLSVFLRMLDVPVPVIYGPSADESPFG